MKKIIIILIVISVFILAFAFIANGFFKMFYLKGEENRNADNFTKGEMVKFDHGTEALAFFEKYSDLPDYNDCNFYYLDNRAKNSYFHKYCSSFVLDLKFDSSDYKNIKGKLSENSHEVSTLNEYELLFCENNGNNSISGVFANDNSEEIRYVFLYGDIIEETADLDSLIKWNTNCDW